MNNGLAEWINTSGSLEHLRRFRDGAPHAEHELLRLDPERFFVALAAELFDMFRNPPAHRNDWAAVGNAFARVRTVWSSEELRAAGIREADVFLMAAAAFYSGGFPASAYVVLKGAERADLTPTETAVFDLLAKRQPTRSALVEGLLRALEEGETEQIVAIVEESRIRERTSLGASPAEWVAERLLSQVLERFAASNVRAVLPPRTPGYWDPLVATFLRQRPPVREFFPSQIAAISAGLLDPLPAMSIQMPTSAGKTTLIETLLFDHLSARPDDAAVLLVPYRSLALELRRGLVHRLARADISARAFYGGSAPSADELTGVSEVRAFVATPETWLGLLASGDELLERISLVVCDEGHLLDSGSRGITLELLLARMRQARPHARFVFVSAIVPNVAQISAWLGNAESGVVQSDYRATETDFSLLRRETSGRNTFLSFSLEIRSRGGSEFLDDRFITAEELAYLSAETGHRRAIQSRTMKARAILAARKALVAGPVAVFAANKAGHQGVVGLAEELVQQLQHPASLPSPLSFVDSQQLAPALDYLAREYGEGWIGTRALGSGAVLHHGDLPQETREVLEELLRADTVRLVLCTSTLAEGVNLPLRTLVLYSVQRVDRDGVRKSLLARDIRNLVGRTGRAGSQLAGLVVCVNPNDWPVVSAVATGMESENVEGALYEALKTVLRSMRDGLALDNAYLESRPDLLGLVDSVDGVLVSLAAEHELADGLPAMAVNLAQATFAAHQSQEASAALEVVMRLRAERVRTFAESGRLAWLRQSGATPRLLASVEETLLAEVAERLTVAEVPAIERLLISWALSLPEGRESMSRSNVRGEASIQVLKGWMSGASYADIARETGISVDIVLRLCSQTFGFYLATTLERTVSLLSSLLNGFILIGELQELPARVRFGVPTASAAAFMEAGVPFRRAAVELDRIERSRGRGMFWDGASAHVRAGVLLGEAREELREILGELVVSRSLSSLDPTRQSG